MTGHNLTRYTLTDWWRALRRRLFGPRLRPFTAADLRAIESAFARGKS